MAGSFLHVIPAFRLGFLFAVGILIGAWSGVSADTAVVAAVLFLAISIFLFGWVRSTPLRSLFLTVITSLLCVSTGTMHMVLESSRTPGLPDSLLKKEVTLLGEVAEAPRKVGERIRFVVEDPFLVEQGGMFQLGGDLLVTMKAGREGADPAAYGNRIAIRGRLFRPSESRNPGEFNQRQFYEAAGITWMLAARSDHAVIVLDSIGGSWVMRELVVPARRYVLDVIDSTVGGQEGELLKGIIIGERGGLSLETKTSFTAAGVSHILAVSGSNVAFIAAMVFFSLELCRMHRRVRIVCACLGVLFYMLLVGNQPPVMRATVMSIVFLTGRLFEEKPNPVNSLGIAALILLGMQPRSIFDVGFQLSFVAVFSIIYFTPKTEAVLKKIPGKTVAGRILLGVLRVAAVSLVASLGTLPLTASYFGLVSVIGLLVNIVVVPASGVSLVLGFVTVAASIFGTGVAAVYAAVNQLLLDLTLRLTLVAGNLPFAAFQTTYVEPVDTLVFYAGVALIFHLGDSVVARRLFLGFLLSLDLWVFIPRASIQQAGILRVTVLDVGQGDAILVEFPDGQTMLIDAGPRSATYDAGGRIIVPFLNRRGIEEVDVLVTTHPHADHIGGAPEVLQNIVVLRVIDCGRTSGSWLSTEYDRLILEEQCVHTSARMGEFVEAFAGARLYVLSPSVGEDMESANLNNSSVVLKLQYGKISFLLAGDAEEEAEGAMAARYRDFLKATVLKAGHHGSVTSSTEGFVSFVQPEFVVVSVGQFNRYGHPSVDVLQRFADRGSEVLRTDQEGAIVFETDGNTIERVLWR